MLLLFNLDLGSGGGGVITISEPDLVGLDAALAVTTLTDVGLIAYASGSAYSEIYPLNTVIDQSPPAGTLVSLGDTVMYTLSLGPDPRNLGSVARMRFKSYAGRLRFKVI